MKAWIIIVNGEVYDTVYYSKDMDKESVKRDLVNHDGYPSSLKLVSE